MGGDVLQTRIDFPNLTDNTCALKVSIALNGSGIVIPSIQGSTIKGADNKYYFLSARALTAWMRRTFGIAPINPNHSFYSGSNITGSPSSLLNGARGIFAGTFDPDFTASGHVDIFEGDVCSVGTCYFGSVINLDFWKLD